MLCDARCQIKEQAILIVGKTPGALQPTPLTRDDALAVQPKQGEREKSDYRSSQSMLIFSTPLTRDACSGGTKLERVRITH